MSFLSNATLRKLGPEIIHPFTVENVEPCSVDFTLADVKTYNWTVEDGQKNWVVYPGERPLASTIERVELPAHIGARVEGKSTWGRRGLLIHITAGWIDAGFEGNITLEFCNLSDTPITLQYGQKICQLAFFFLDQPADPPYNGKYQGQVGITEAR